LKEICDFYQSNDGIFTTQELADCIGLMCGGSSSEKLEAYFILFDLDFSNMLSFDELTDMLAHAFTTFANIAKTRNCEDGSFFRRPDMVLLSKQTASKCFKDLKIPTQEEINF
jgi:Ca2+-binding EF-hand superfamily protein